MTNSPYWRDAIIVFARMSGWIVSPLILGLFFGRWLDTRFHTAPFLFFGTIGLAFFASAFGIIKESKKYLKSIEKNNLEKNERNESKN